jgi:hypothetical protein
MLRSLLFQTSIPAPYWVEGLHTTTYPLNRLPTKAIIMTSPYFAIHGVAPSYEHLRVFGCTCYPNLSAKAVHKLAPRSTRCIFLGYSVDHKGYRCLDLTTTNIVVSQYVVFDEADFPFSTSPRLTNNLDIFLQDNSRCGSHAGTTVDASRSLRVSAAGRGWRLDRARNRG